METVTAKISKIYYYSPDSGFHVLGMTREGREESADSGYFSATGVFPTLLRVGQILEMTGENSLSKYGQTFKVRSFKEILPTDADSIYKYLASGMVKGIGPVTARRLVDKFGDKTLDVLENDPESVKELKGIGKKVLEKISSSMEEQKGTRELMLFLKGHDIPNGIANKIYRTYGEDSMAVLKENPYRLADEMEGVGFKKADAVARSLGMDLTNPHRIKSGVIFTLKTAAEEGSTFLPEDELIAKAASGEVLGLESTAGVEKAVKEMKVSRGEKERAELIDDGGNIYLPYLFICESNVAKKVKRMAKFSLKAIPIDLAEICRKTGKAYNTEQRNAIASSLSRGMTVITGGPGTGKTVTVEAIITAAEMAGKNVLLAAPTGRAAKRMTEVSGRKAKTIHRLLEYGQDGFYYNKENPLKGDLLIVDEVSMLDISLAYSLLQAVPDEMRLVLVGDNDQLPSVGCGRVLKDIIDSERVSVIRLTRIYRQGEKSRIVTNAHAVNEGKMPDLGNDADDFRFFREDEREGVRDRILRLYVRLVAKHGMDKVQILTPMRRNGDPIGAADLNKAVQALVNGTGDEVERGATIFRKNDKVMQMKNDYDKDVFNGDIGVVSSVNPAEKAVTVNFYGREVTYVKGELDGLELAYATTVHKSQGSEYSIVLVPVHMSQYIMLQRNLLYTAMTRAKRCCVLVGTQAAISTAVHRAGSDNRKTALKDKIILA